MVLGFSLPALEIKSWGKSQEFVVPFEFLLEMLEFLIPEVKFCRSDLQPPETLKFNQIQVLI